MLFCWFMLFIGQQGRQRNLEYSYLIWILHLYYYVDVYLRGGVGVNSTRGGGVIGFNTQLPQHTQKKHLRYQHTHPCFCHLRVPTVFLITCRDRPLHTSVQNKTSSTSTISTTFEPFVGTLAVFIVSAQTCSVYSNGIQTQMQLLLMPKSAKYRHSWCHSLQSIQKTKEGWWIQYNGSQMSLKVVKQPKSQRPTLVGLLPFNLY